MVTLEDLGDRGQGFREAKARSSLWVLPMEEVCLEGYTELEREDCRRGNQQRHWLDSVTVENVAIGNVTIRGPSLRWAPAPSWHPRL